MRSLLLVALLLAVASAKIYFQEDFDAPGWESRWVVSKFKGAEAGKFEVKAGKVTGDPKDKGLKTTQDAKFYQISAKFPEFSNKGKTLVLQYSVKHEQTLDCGGGYIKLLPKGVDQENFSGDSSYNIMFGPDICGYASKRTHVIFNYKGENHLITKEIKPKDDDLTHLYTLIVRPDNTYEVLIDNASVQKGNLIDDWKFLPPKEIKDPNSKKPSDWVDDAEIPDPTDVKPEGYDDIPQHIPDPDATKPDDWDEDADGTWEAPMIDNPEFKGEWKPRQIKNPGYKGPWVHPLIPNPDYKEDANIYSYDSHAVLGIEIWQVKSGSIFDNFLVTDDEKEAQKHAEVVLDKIKREKTEFEKIKEQKEAAEKKKLEEEAAKKEDESEDVEGEDDEEQGKKKSKDEL